MPEAPIVKMVSAAAHRTLASRLPRWGAATAACFSVGTISLRPPSACRSCLTESPGPQSTLDRILWATDSAAATLACGPSSSRICIAASLARVPRPASKGATASAAARPIGSKVSFAAFTTKISVLASCFATLGAWVKLKVPSFERPFIISTRASLSSSFHLSSSDSLRFFTGRSLFEASCAARRTRKSSSASAPHTAEARSWTLCLPRHCTKSLRTFQRSAERPHRSASVCSSGEPSATSFSISAFEAAA
mmetsp:Transcript_35272/g.75142  ORF Transcript_35272/g.75142 Transcript_35272/m.75142 type:complete len:251 (-) Transcript_35272:831-1583(-)